MAYSDAEIRAFAERDKRIVRQSSLKVAADIVFFIGISENVVLSVKEIAQQLTNWVYEKPNSKDLFVAGKDGSMIVGEQTDEKVTIGNRAPTLGQLPEPTLQQKKVLDVIAGKQNKTQVDPQLKFDVLRWAKATHGQQSYPTKLDSVETFLKWFKTL